MTYTYRILGEPLVHIQGQEGKLRSWTTYKQNKTAYEITVEAQHDDRPKLQGPLTVEIHLYQKEGWGKNDISSYSRFIEHILADIVYSNYQNITDLISHRIRVKKDPCTIIYVTEKEKE